LRTVRADRLTKEEATREAEFEASPYLKDLLAKTEASKQTYALHPLTDMQRVVLSWAVHMGRAELTVGASRE
jgi:hypothetical protein